MSTERPANKIAEELTALRMLVEKKSEAISDGLLTLFNEIKSHENTKICFHDNDIAMFGELLQWSNSQVKARAAEILALLAKKENFRERCLNTNIVPWLCGVIKNPAKDDYSIDAVMNSCRALGNLCYENSRHRKHITENGGIKILMDVIRFAVTLPQNNEINVELRSASVGLLLNYLDGQQEFYPMALESGIVDLLIDVLNAGTKDVHGGNAGVHTLIVLGAFADLLAVDNKPILNEKLCNALVKCLKESTPGELSELCIELVHSQTEYASVPPNLAKAGIIQVLMDLLEQHENISQHNELRNIFKMACDVIILILNDDETMKMLYDNGKGPVFMKLVQWMSHSNEDLQVTGVLAMGNFARTDGHCIEMVKQGIDKILVDLLKKNNTEAGNLKYQHALLSALRNLVIPAQNKQILIKDGLLDALYLMLSVTSFPIVFKLLGTLRLIVDGQEKVACEMGHKKELLLKLVEWCKIDHAGVQGEACRLISWIIKNSRDRDVMGFIVECKALPSLMEMITSNHSVMQNEALLALSVLCSMRLSDAEQSLLDSNIGKQLNNLLTNHNPEKEIFQNLLTLVGQLCESNILKMHLRQCAIPTALLTFLKSSEKCSDLKDQVSRLVTMLESG